MSRIFSYCPEIIKSKRNIKNMRRPKIDKKYIFRENPAGYPDRSRPIRYKGLDKLCYALTDGCFHSDSVD